MSTFKLGVLAGLALFGGATAQAETFTAVSSEASEFPTSELCRFDGEAVETKNSWVNYTFINHYRPGGRGSEGEVNNELAKQIENGDFTLQHSPAGGFKTSDPCLVDEYGFGQIKIL